MALEFTENDFSGQELQVTSDPAPAAAGAGAGAGFDPSGAAVGLYAVNTILSAIAQHQAAKARKKLAEYRATVARYQADDAIARGEMAVRRSRVRGRQLTSTARASLAGQGVDLGIGSAVDVEADIAYLTKFDEIIIRNNAAREAWGYRVQAAEGGYQGRLAQREGELGAVTTILGGASRLALAKYGFGRSPLSQDPLSG